MFEGIMESVMEPFNVINDNVLLGIQKTEIVMILIVVVIIFQIIIVGSCAKGVHIQQLKKKVDGLEKELKDLNERVKNE